MCIQVNMDLIARVMVETARNLLVILLEFLGVKLKENYAELVSLDQSTFWIDFEWLWNYGRESEVGWCVSFVLKLDCLEFAFIKRTRSKMHLIIR